MTQTFVSAVARLLDREMPEDYLAEWTEIISAKPKKVEARATSAVVFRLGSEWLALPTTAFQEIAELGGIHKLPHSSNSVLNGLVNVRGELLLCASLDVLLGLEKVPAGRRDPERSAGGRLLVCEYKGERVAFPVSEVVGIHTYFLKDVRNVPATLTRSATCILEILYWKDKAIGCLDIGRLYEALNKGLK